MVPVLDFSKPLNCTGQALNPGPRPICMLLNRCKHVHLEPGQIMADHYQTLVKTRRTEEISFKHYCCVSTEELQPSEEVVFKLTWDGPPYGFITNCPCPHFSSRFQRKKKNILVHAGNEGWVQRPETQQVHTVHCNEGSAVLSWVTARERPHTQINKTVSGNAEIALVRMALLWYILQQIYFLEYTGRIPVIFWPCDHKNNITWPKVFFDCVSFL